MPDVPQPVDTPARTQGFPSPITLKPMPGRQIALSTASVYPESTAMAFEIAAEYGYDGVEVMVWTDPVSQDADELSRLSEQSQVPVLALHAPCLLATQRVWGFEPWQKLRRSREVAEQLGARTVVLHPPFAWQRDYAQRFTEGLIAIADGTGITFAVENMYPLRLSGRSRRKVSPYLPNWDVTKLDTRLNLALDLSHAAVAGVDAEELFDAMGDRLTHVHLSDGTGRNRDEHLLPGYGTQPCARVLNRLAANQFSGVIAVEVNTRRALSRAARREDLGEALVFTWEHLAPQRDEPAVK